MPRETPLQLLLPRYAHFGILCVDEIPTVANGRHFGELGAQLKFPEEKASWEFPSPGREWRGQAVPTLVPANVTVDGRDPDAAAAGRAGHRTKGRAQ